jgi:pyruvate dehydrogenase E1 component beta subunit
MEESSVRVISYLQAIQEGFAAGMRRDETSFIVGEGIAERGGAFAHTKGLYEEFGPERVIDVPISESAFTGMCAGAAACGSRAIVDFMYIDFAALAMDQIVNQAAKIRYISCGQFAVPLTLNAVFGIGNSGAAHHSQPLHPWFMYTPGIKVVMPSTPYDVKGLLASAVVDDNPVVVLEHRLLLNVKGEVPEEDYIIPLGEARVCRQGDDVTIVATALAVHHALEAAERLEQRGVSAEVIDPRTLKPLDVNTIAESVRKTNRLVVADEGYSMCGVGAEIVAHVQEEVFDYLDAPMERIHTLDCPVPYAPSLEAAIVPNAERICDAALKAVNKL